MPRKVVGDPLTGSLPRTHLVVPQAIMGPVRKKAALAWPHVPDPMAVTMMQMVPGHVAYVRTRFGIRRLQIRVVAASRQRPNKGRHYFVGQDRHGWCRTYWLDRVARVAPVRLALGRGGN